MRLWILLFCFLSVPSYVNAKEEDLSWICMSRADTNNFGAYVSVPLRGAAEIDYKGKTYMATAEVEGDRNDMMWRLNFNDNNYTIRIRHTKDKDVSHSALRNGGFYDFTNVAAGETAPAQALFCAKIPSK